MKRLSGPISDRLRKLFSPADPAWTPPRQSASKPIPPGGVGGGPVGGKPGRKAQQ